MVETEMLQIDNKLFWIGSIKNELKMSFTVVKLPRLTVI